MPTTYLPYDDDPENHLPNVRPVADPELLAALRSLYALAEAEQDGKYYLIFDYRLSLPAEAEKRAELPPDILDRAIAMLEFDRKSDRDREVQEIRLSLFGGDDGAGNPTRPSPSPPSIPGGEARYAAERSVRPEAS
jgi:hypothetical protein